MNLVHGFIKKTLFLPLFILLLCFLLNACNGGGSSSSPVPSPSPTSSPTPSPTPTPTSSILFGTQNGLVFANSTILSGNSALTTIDSSKVQALVIDSNHNIYAGTFGNTFNPGQFGAGKVFQYDVTTGYWKILAGKGAGGSLDGSNVVALIVDSSNNLYAGTYGGNVYKYVNRSWTIMGLTLGSPIQTMTIDANNNIYVGINNGNSTDNNVYKYTNGVWTSFGSPDGTSVQSITINSSGDIYAATSGNGGSGNGQVYKYISGITWHSISSFTSGPINVITSFDNNLYAGTNDGRVYQHNSGNSWSALGLTPDGTAITALIVNSSDIYAGTAGNSDNGQVFHYNGPNWEQISTLNNGAISTIIFNNNILYTSTANSGNSTGMVYEYVSNLWAPIGAGGTLDGTPVYSTTIDSNNNFYAGTQSNVFKYAATNKTWSLLGNIGILDSSGINALATYESEIYAGTNSGNIFMSNITNSNWLTIGTNTNYIISYLTVNSNGQLYASLYDISGGPTNGIVKKYNSTNRTWTILAGTGTNHSLDDSTITSITTDTAGNLYATTAGTGNGGFVWEYPVNGNSWEILGIGTLDGSAVNSVTTDSNLNVYAGTAAGNIFKYNGSVWSIINQIPLDTSGISALNFGSSGELYATTMGGMVWEYLQTSGLWANTNYGINVSINFSGSKGF